MTCAVAMPVASRRNADVAVVVSFVVLCEQHIHNVPTAMNRLLSFVLLVALAAVSPVEGFATSGAIPVMGGAVGGTYVLMKIMFASTHHRLKTRILVLIHQSSYMRLVKTK